MARWCRIEHHKTVAALTNRVRKSAKDCDLFSTRRTQVFRKQRFALFIKSTTRVAHHVLRVLGSLGNWIDSANRQIRKSFTRDCSCDVGCWICSREVDGEASFCQGDGNCRGDRGFANASLAHCKDHTMFLFGQIIY